MKERNPRIDSCDSAAGGRVAVLFARQDCSQTYATPRITRLDRADANLAGRI